MRRILAITSVSLRQAVRSRVVLTVMALLLIVIVALPLTVEGDGTLSGHVQIVLNYTLSLAGLLLAVMSIWLGCAGVSSEIRDRELHLVLTKPVHPAQVWLGKWLGILVLDAVLLTFAMAVTYGLLMWTTRPATLTAEEQKRLNEEILTARQVYRPQPPDVAARARELLAEYRSAGRIDPDVPDAEALTDIRAGLLLRARTAGPGEQRRWTFDLGRRPDEGQPIYARYRFDGSRKTRESVAGMWHVGPPDDPDSLRKLETATPGGTYSFEIPARAVGPQGKVVLSYGNIHHEPITVIFSSEEGLEVLVTRGGFAANMVRGGLVIFCRLAFLSALALAAGCAFSLPVAAFASLWAVFLLQIGGYLESLATRESLLGAAAAEPSALAGIRDAVFRAVFRMLNAVVQPLQGPDPLAYLTSGQLVSWGLVGLTFAVRVLLYSSVLALLSTWVLNRREIGLPQ